MLFFLGCTQRIGRLSGSKAVVSISSEGIAYPEGASTCRRCRLWSFFRVSEFRVEGLGFRCQCDVLVLGRGWRQGPRRRNS